MSQSRKSPLVHLAGVGKSYRAGPVSVDALSEVNLSLHAGDFVSIVGPSGCGKTTTLNTIGARDTPTAGSCRIAGLCTRTRDMTGLARRPRDTPDCVCPGF